MGKWAEQQRELFDTRVLSCSLCGKTIPGRYWYVTEGGTEHCFCDPECEQLYRTYWLPRYSSRDQWPRE